MGGCECNVTCMPHPHLHRSFWKNTEGSPTAVSGDFPGWQAPVPPLLSAGVTGILATELFDQMARPAAYMVCGALMWIMLFLVGLGFPFIMVGLPLPQVPVRMKTPVGGLHPRRLRLKGLGLI